MYRAQVALGLSYEMQRAQDKMLKSISIVGSRRY